MQIMNAPAQFTLLRQQAHVDGAWIDADSGRRFDVVDPATRRVIASVPDLGAAETERAIAAADAALPAWRSMLAAERAKLLREWFRMIVENTDELAAIMTAEQGKPLFEARG